MNGVDNLFERPKTFSCYFPRILCLAKGMFKDGFKMGAFFPEKIGILDEGGWEIGFNEGGCADDEFSFECPGIGVCFEGAVGRKSKYAFSFPWVVEAFFYGKYPEEGNVISREDLCFKVDLASCEAFPCNGIEFQSVLFFFPKERATEGGIGEEDCSLWRESSLFV